MTKTSLKKLTSIVLAVLMLLSVFSVTAFAAGTDTASTGDRTILFTDNQGWGTVYVHYWGGSSASTWPGVQMSLSGDDGYGNNQFSAQIPDDTTGVVFTKSSSGPQTVDGALTSTIAGFYTDGTQTDGKFNLISWSNSGPDDTYDTSDTDPDDPYIGGTRTILFTDNQGWGSVRVHYFGGSSESTWPGISMTQSGDDGYGNAQFMAQIPDDSTGVVFNNGGTAQTADGDITDSSIEGFYTEGEVDDMGHFLLTSWGGSGNTDDTFETDDPWDTSDPWDTLPSDSQDTRPSESQQTTPTTPSQTTAPTAPVVTDPSSETSPTDPAAADEDKFLYVSAKSNINSAGSKVKVTDDYIKVSYTLKTPAAVDDGQISISYDTNKLSLNPMYNTSSSMFPVIKDAQYNLNAASGVIVFNFSGINGKYDFTKGDVLVELVFSKKSSESTGTATVYMKVFELSSKSASYVDDGAVKSDAVTVSQSVESVAPQTSKETEASTSAVNNLKINVSSNVSTEVKTYDITSSNAKVKFSLTADELISYGDATITFDNTKLALESRYNTADTMFTTINSQVSYRLHVSDGVMKFCFTNVDMNTQKGTYDFTKGGEIITLVFTVRSGAEGTANVNLNMDQLGSIDTKYIENGAVITAKATITAVAEGEKATASDTEPTTVPIATGEITEPSNPSGDTTPSNPSDDTTPSNPSDDTTPSNPSDDTTPSNPSDDTTPSNPSDDTTPSNPSGDTTPSTPSGDTTPSNPSGDTTPSNPSGDTTPSTPSGDTTPTTPGGSTPTTPGGSTTPRTTLPSALVPSLNEQSTTIRAAGTYNIIINNLGGSTVTYTSSNTKVALVDEAGKVTGLNKGTATINVKVGTTNLSFRVTVKNKVVAKINGKYVKANKVYKVKKGKTLKVKFYRRVKSINNVYTSSKKSVAKVVSKAKTNIVKIKAKKKGKATIKILVNGARTFRIKVKVK